MNVPEKQQQIQLIYSLISSTDFLSFIKNKLEIRAPTVSDIKDVIGDNFMILRARKAKTPQQIQLDNLNEADCNEAENNPEEQKEVFEKSIHYDVNDPSYQIQSESSMIIIVVYGLLQILGKTYSKGEYAIFSEIHLSNYLLSIRFIKPTTLIYINAEILVHRIEYVRELNQKVFDLERCLPTNKMKLTKSEIRKLARKIQIKSIAHNQYIDQKQSRAFDEDAIVIFMSGIFQICYLSTPKQQNELRAQRNRKYTPIHQFQTNFFYFQLEFNSFYRIKLKSLNGKYAILPISTLYGINEGEKAVLILREIQSCRSFLNKNKEIAKNYEKEAKQRKIKISRKIKTIYQNFHQTPTQRETKNEDLNKTRISMLNKSLPLFSTAKSLQPKKQQVRYETVQDSSGAKSRFFRTRSKAWSNRSNKTEKNINKLNFESTYERTLQMSEDKLDRMRRYETLKGFTKIKQQFWLSNTDLDFAKGNTFYSFRQNRMNENEVAKFENLKRTFMVKSTGRLKKGLIFTDRR